MSTGQVWLTNTLGGYMWSPALSKVLRVVVQPLVKFRQFADVKDAAVQGKGKGQEFHWNVYSDVATQGTTLLETTTMPETNYTITQGTMTITEYGNSVPYTEKQDDLSLHPVKEVIAKVLKNDAKKAFDIAAYNQFNGTPLTVVPERKRGRFTSTHRTSCRPRPLRFIVLEARRRRRRPTRGLKMA